MTLGQKQELFAWLIGRLLVWAHDQGIAIRIGDVFAKTGHMPNSNHYLKLAADLYTFQPGEQEQDMDAHRRMHDCWDALCEEVGQDGGRIDHDMNHYSFLHEGRR